MNSKQTDNNEQKKTMPEDWSPVSSIGGKTKMVKPTNENVETEFQKVLAEGEITGNRHLTDKSESNVNSDTAVETEVNTNPANSLQTEPTLDTRKRISGKQRKESLEDYRETFLQVPKLEDRKPVFISCEVRDKLDEITRKLGGRKMSVSGFIENLARQHLVVYQDDIEMWKKL